VERSYSESGLTVERSVLKTRLQNNKEQIFCSWRHRWVRLTPEEWVRQQLLHRLVEQLGYPASRIAVEVPFKQNQTISNDSKQFRADAVVYDAAMQPLVLIECKAETVPLTRRTLDQALTYNRLLAVPYLMLHNGPQTLMTRVTADSITPLSAVLPYSEL